MAATSGLPLASSERCGETALSSIDLLDSEFDRFYATVYRYLLHRVFDRELADELTAETFYRAASAASRLPGDRRQMQMWLLRIATNIANSHQRRLRWRKLLVGRWAASRPTTDLSVHAAEAGDEPQAAVRAVLSGLPANKQAVIVLRYYAQLSFEEIAEILGCRPDAVRARLSRAIRCLRRQLVSHVSADTTKTSRR